LAKVIGFLRKATKSLKNGHKVIKSLPKGERKFKRDGKAQ